MHTQSITDIRDNPALREGFFDLARRVFGLDFEPWYNHGHWLDRYIPTVLLEDGIVVANVSANRIDLRRDGGIGRYIQLGTVMTDPTCRQRGYSRLLMDAVLAHWIPRCDGIYLFANDAVLDFYPRFGFVPAQESVCHATVYARRTDLRRLDMDTDADRALLLACYKRDNPYSALTMVDNPGLLMFYCDGPLRAHVYHSESMDVAAIATHAPGQLLCYDLYGSGHIPLTEVLGALATEPVTQVELGFTPRDTAPFAVSPRAEPDETLFVLEGAGVSTPAWLNQPGMLPLLSHA